MSNRNNDPVSNEDLKKVIRAQLHDDLKQQMLEWEATETTVRTLPRYPRYLWAASIAMLVCLGAFWYLFLQQENMADPILTYLDAPELIIDATQRGGADEQRLAFWNAYQEKAYADQIVTYTLLPDSLQDREEYRFYLAMAQFQEERWKQASTILQEVIDSGVLFSKEAAWFQALADYQELGAEAAQAKLAKIADSSGHPYQQSAKELLSELQ